MSREFIPKTEIGVEKLALSENDEKRADAVVMKMLSLASLDEMNALRHRIQLNRGLVRIIVHYDYGSKRYPNPKDQEHGAYAEAAEELRLGAERHMDNAHHNLRSAPVIHLREQIAYDAITVRAKVPGVYTLPTDPNIGRMPLKFLEEELSTFDAVKRIRKQAWDWAGDDDDDTAEKSMYHYLLSQFAYRAMLDRLQVKEVLLAGMYLDDKYNRAEKCAGDIVRAARTLNIKVVLSKYVANSKLRHTVTDEQLKTPPKPDVRLKLRGALRTITNKTTGRKYK